MHVIVCQDACQIKNMQNKIIQVLTSRPLILTSRYADCDDAGFECDDGQCIKGEWECDYDPDCDDGSDEHAQCPGEL